MEGSIVYEITEKQVNNLQYIIERLTVTGPEQGRLLYVAGETLKQVQCQKCGNAREVETK